MQLVFLWKIRQCVWPVNVERMWRNSKIKYHKTKFLKNHNLNRSKRKKNLVKFTKRKGRLDAKEKISYLCSLCVSQKKSLLNTCGLCKHFSSRSFLRIISFKFVFRLQIFSCFYTDTEWKNTFFLSSLSLSLFLFLFARWEL